jgi:hypothetical protein
VLFRGLLDAKEDAISAGLQLLLTSAPQYGKVRATPQNDILTASSWMQQSVPVLDDHVTVLMPGSNTTPLLEGSLTADTDMQPLDHLNNFQALSNVNDQFPGSNLSPARLSSRGNEPQVEHDTFETLTSHHGSALSDRFAEKDGATDCDRRLRSFIGQLIFKKATKGCGHIRSHEHQSGKFVCTLGCGRRFRTSADTFRHEEIVFPQQFWFCYTCGDRNDPSERYLFTREDKMRQHIKKAGHVTTSPNHCRVPNIRTFFPEKCNLCSHHRHRNWKERCKHIIWHCKRGHFATNTNPLGTGQTQEHLVTGGDDDDDDDDDGEDDDDEDGDNHRLNDLTDQGNGEGPSNWKLNYDNEDNDGDNGDEFFERWMRDSPGLYDYPSSVRITSLHTPDEQGDVKTSIAWIKWNKKQAIYEDVSSMFTVEVLPVLEDGVKSEPRTCIVKQYSARHHDLFEREVQALTVSEKQRGCTNINRCHGTFEYIDDSGQQQYNVLLEHNESRLNPKPHDINSTPASTMARPVALGTNPTKMRERSQPSSDHIPGCGKYEDSSVIKKDVDCPVYRHDRLGKNSSSDGLKDPFTGSEACPTTNFTGHKGVLAELEALVYNTQSRRSFCLHGIAGTGKSTIARTIAQSYNEAGHASFFFSSQSDHRDICRSFQSFVTVNLRQSLPREFSHIGFMQQKHTFGQWNRALATEIGHSEQTALSRAAAAGHSDVVVLLLDAAHKSVVEEVQHTLNLKVFARKTIPTLRRTQERQARLFKHEVNIIRNLGRHQHIVTVLATYMAAQNYARTSYKVPKNSHKAQLELFNHMCTNGGASFMNIQFANVLLSLVPRLDCYQPSFHRGGHIRHSVLQGRIIKRSGRIQTRAQPRPKQYRAGSARALRIWSCILFQCEEDDDSAEPASC